MDINKLETSTREPLRFALLPCCFALLLLLSGLSGGCDTDFSSPEERPKVLFIALDGTGSYSHLRQAKRSAVRALEKVPPGSKVYVRWITGNSAAPEASIVSGYIPSEAENPYDTNTRGQSARKKLAQAVAEATSPKSRTTDLQGLLWAASKRFEKHPGLGRKLLLATDLHGNSGRDFPKADLTSTSVRVVGFEVDPSRPKRAGRWKDTFREAGADTTTIRYLDQPIRDSDRR